ncbi:hypothetical protein JCM11641_007619 [Rhodosporidiobolus odoratus]
MPIKLLHHKSWHVYSATNIERVKRDEAIAAAKAEGDEERANKAEAEARVDRMRSKARKRTREDADDLAEREMDKQLKGKRRDDRGRETDKGNERDRAREKEKDMVRAEVVRPEGCDLISKGKGKGKEKEGEGNIMTNGHLNFWAELEAGTAAPSNTSAVAARLKAEREKELEDSATKVFLAKRGEGEPKGWYADKEGLSEKERREGDEERLERTYKDAALKRLTDPLALMNQYLTRRSAVLSGSSLPTARQPSSRDRYITPSSASAYSSSDTPRTSRGAEDPYAPIEPKLLPPPRRKGDPIPPPSPPRRSVSSSSSSLVSSSTATHPRGDPKAEAASRVSSERARAAALVAARKKAALSSSASSSIAASTPARSETGGWGMYNRDEVRAAKEAREGNGQGRGWEDRGRERIEGGGTDGRGGWGALKKGREDRERDRGYGGYRGGRRDEGRRR